MKALAGLQTFHLPPKGVKRLEATIDFMLVLFSPFSFSDLVE